MKPVFQRTAPCRHCSRPRPLFLLLMCGLWVSIGPVRAQPPEPAPIESRADGQAIMSSWRLLYQQTGEREILDPEGTITSYTRFLDSGAHEMPPVLGEVSFLIGQIYLQQLNNRPKAVEVYERAIMRLEGHSWAGILSRELQNIQLSKKPLPKPITFGTALRNRPPSPFR